jgi:hypothetical protein
VPIHIAELSVALFILAGSTTGSYKSGNDLLNDCTSNTDSQLVCIGYIQGVADTWAAFRAVSSRPDCVPEGVLVRQLRDVVLRFLQAHPEHRHSAATSLVMNAFAEAWHCSP